MKDFNLRLNIYVPNYRQGIYEIKNWDKYVGTRNPRYLSSYELTVFRFLDNHPSIIEWGSETVIVPYYNPVKQRMSRYMVDIYVKYKNKNGDIIKELVEIKPESDLKKPTKRGKKKRSTIIYEEATYITNQAKWEAATKFAENHGMRFRVITEKHIFH